MSQYRDGNDYDSGAEMPTWDLTTLSDSALRDLNDVNESSKLRSVMKASSIVNQSTVALVGIMCQTEIRNRVSILTRINPEAGRDLEALAVANMLYIRDLIYKPKNNGR